MNHAEEQPVQTEEEKMLWEKLHQGWKLVDHPVFNSVHRKQNAKSNKALGVLLSTLQDKMQNQST